MTEHAEALTPREPGVYRCRVAVACNGCSAALTGYVAEGPTPEAALEAAAQLARTEARGAGWRLSPYPKSDRCPTCVRRKP